MFSLHLALALLFLPELDSLHLGMHWLLDLRLITLTAGTLLPFFWMVVILGHRRQRNFERVFFFLCLALACFFGSSLLHLNAQLYYGAPPQPLSRFAWIVLCLGLFFIPPLVVHLHVEWASMRGLFPSPFVRNSWLALTWLATATLVGEFIRALDPGARVVDFERPTHVLGVPFQVWLVLAILLGVLWQHRFAASAPDREQRRFHRTLEIFLSTIAVLLAATFLSQRFVGAVGSPLSALLAMILVLVPLGILFSNVQRFNFLQIGRQRNLVYAVSAIFVALLYLSFVRRAAQWFEPYLPPEASAALLLFLPVAFFEPLQRGIRRLLQQTAQTEIDRAQKLIAPINEAARAGDPEAVRQFAEQWIRDQLQLAEVHLLLDSPDAPPKFTRPALRDSEEAFEIRGANRHIGTLTIRAHGAMISGETYAALEFVSEQLPAAFDLCRLIGEKLQLERELAERDRLALVGQMAASISHNLKNPLGSIKTILQVQLESAELPNSLRAETRMVLDEINRLSSKLNQLLQFSRPGSRTSGALPERCDIAHVAETVSEVFRHEADHRGVVLEFQPGGPTIEVRASAESANDILSNLLLNALEASPNGGRVRLFLATANGHCRVSVEDDGEGIPLALKEKILQPFFTTKARGTGLGLAIVARRIEELKGQLDVESPIERNRGSRFVVTLPLVPKDHLQP